MESMSTLFIVATPIGNLGDISRRAIETLKEVDVILAEDTRVAGGLIEKLGIKKKRVISYHQHSSEAKKLEILRLIQEGKNMALITDAGTPGVSDPGNELIDFIYSMGRPDAGSGIRPVPGPSAVTAALSVCGFDVSRYIFLGFMPKRKVGKVIEVIKVIKLPFVYFDSPHRVIKNLEKLREPLGERRVLVAREMTKLHETHYRGSISEVIKMLSNESKLKGEITVVVEKEKKFVSPAGVEPAFNP